MQVHTFIVDSAVEAVEQVRAKLGPDAVVLSVRRLPADGLSKLWRKPRIEVLAAAPPASPEAMAPIAESGLVSSAAAVVPVAAPVQAVPADPLAELRRELSEIRAEVFRGRVQTAAQAQDLPPAAAPTAIPDRMEPAPLTIGSFVTKGVAYPGTWNVGPILEATGLMPVHALRIVEQLCQDHGEEPPKSLGEELLLAAKALQGEWLLPPTPPSGPLEVHVFIGPPGSGKTTALCKWLAQAVLVEGRKAEVWRLDGMTSNTAESLSVYGEILGVPVERFVPERPPEDGLLFIDLPGVAAGDVAGLEDLRGRLSNFGPVQVHLVLNAAYESALVLAQARAYAGLGVTDVVASHLDEEPRWGKLWNWILGTNFPVGWLGVGQNIPGQFHRADPNRILARQFSRES